MSALSIWSNNVLHLAWCREDIALLDCPSDEVFIIKGSFSWLDGNSFDIKKGNSVVITARTLFLLRRNAASIEHGLLPGSAMHSSLKPSEFYSNIRSLPERRPLMSWWRSSNHWEATLAAESRERAFLSWKIVMPKELQNKLLVNYSVRYY